MPATARPLPAGPDPEQVRTIDRLIAGHAGQPGNLLPILHAVQDALGYIPPDAIPQIAAGLNLSRADVHGVVSFYHYFRTHPVGRHIVSLCRAEACQAMGCDSTIDHAKQALGVDFHGTTADGSVTLEAVYCLGNCAAAPAMLVDRTLHARVTPERFDAIVASLRKAP